MFALVSGQRNVCVKEVVGRWEISVAFDDSCGAMQQLSRSDIRVFRGDEDCTYEVFGNDEVIVGTLENLVKVYEWCKVHA